MKETIESLKKATLEEQERTRSRIATATDQQLEDAVLKVEGKLKESMSDWAREVTKEVRAALYQEIERRRLLNEDVYMNACVTARKENELPYGFYKEGEKQ